MRMLMLPMEMEINVILWNGRTNASVAYFCLWTNSTQKLVWMADFRKIPWILNWVVKKRYKKITEELLKHYEANTKTLQIQRSINQKCLDLLHLLYESMQTPKPHSIKRNDDTGCRETVEE